MDDVPILRYERSFHLDSPAQSLIFLKEHLVYGGVDRSLRWCTYPEFDLKQIATLPSNSMSSITNIIPSPFYEKCIVGTDFGSLHEIKLEVDDLEDQVSDQSNRLLQVASHHSGAILGLCVVTTGAGYVLSTVGEDGSVRLWNLGNNTLLKTKRFDSVAGEDATPTAITACESHDELPLQATGSAQGALRIMFVDRTTNSADLTELEIFKLFDCPITELKFHPTEPLVVAASLERGNVYIISINPESELAVVAHSKLPKKETVRSLVWKGMQVLVTSDEKKLYGLDVEGNKLTPAGLEEVPMTKMHTWDSPSTCVALVQVETDVLITGSIDSSELKCYTTEDAGQIIAAKCTAAAHEKGTVCIRSAPKCDAANHGAFCSGGADGSVILWTIRQEGGITLTPQQKFVVHNGPVVSASFSRDSRTMFTCGLDGAIFSFNIKIAGAGKINVNKGLQTFAEFRALAAAAKSTGMVDDEVKDTTWFEDLKNEVEKIAAVEHEAFKSSTRGSTENIIAKLQTLLETNNRVPDLERMDRKEFVIDKKAEEESLLGNEKRVQSTREKIENQITELEVHAERIKKECWDSMDTHGRELHALKSGVVVQNYPLRKWSPDQTRKFDKIQLLRKLEIKEIKAAQGANSKNCWNGTTEEVPDDIGWIINTGQLQMTGELNSLTIDDGDAKKKSKNDGAKDPTKSKEASANGKDDDDDDDDDDNDKEVGEGNDDSSSGEEKQLTLSALLYPPMALRTCKQKRTQIHLLAALVRQMQGKFNTKFGELFTLKQDEVDKIENKNERIKEILHELKIEDSYFTPQWDPAEDPQKVFEVEDDEMTQKPYITEAMRIAQQKEEEERLRREEEAKKDDIGGRALMDMMNGTLEVKKDGDALEQVLVREEWMDQLTYEDMDDDQRRELEDFEARVKALEEEKEKQRKALELELKKLKTDIADVCRVFDDKVKELYDMRMRTQMVIFTEELYMVRLGLSVMEREDETQVTTELQSQLASELSKKVAMSEKATIARKAVDKYKEDLTVLQDEDRLAERNVKRELSEANGGPLDQDTVKILIQLFKLRKSGAESSIRQSGSTARRSSMSISRRSSISKRKSWQVLRGSVSRRGSSGAFGGNRGSSKLGGGAGNSMQAAMQEAVKESERTSSQMDPFKAIDERAQRVKDKERVDFSSVMLDMDTDCPEGFMLDDETVWRKLQEMRMAKIAGEKEIKKRMVHFTELKRQAEVLESADNNSAQKIKLLQLELEAVKKRREFESRNLEALILMKQGQDEVEQEAVVTEYGDAVLVRRTVVEEKNAGIEKLGKDKVNTLGKIKNFRKNINFMIWDHKYLESVASDLEDHYTDLQLLRVTKSLQTFIKGGDTADQQKVDLEKVRTFSILRTSIPYNFVPWFRILYFTRHSFFSF
jgi:WD40 repeat protein